jgi:hypothetical protein
MKWLCGLLVVAARVTPYAEWRARHRLLPVAEQRKSSRHSTSLCQLKKAEKAHIDAEVSGASFLQRHVVRGEPKPEAKPLPYDGYFTFGCYMDGSPPESRLDYKAEMERTFEEAKPVDAAVCFEFCRDRPKYKFFALTLGRDCYCAEYVHRAPGGSDRCDRVCEGNHGQMCGGDHKASLYEMHRCSDTIDEAEETLHEVTQFREYAEALTSNASYLLNGMDMTADAVDVAEVRHEIFNNSRALNRLIRGVQDLGKECGELDKACRGLIPETDPANVDHLQKLEGAQRSLAKTCAEAPGDPMKGTGFQVAVQELYHFLHSHDVQDALGAAGASLDAVAADGKSGDYPNSLNRMTKAAIASIGCDDDPADGCDGFNLIFWPQGPTVKWFTDFYVPAQETSPMSADEWKLTFIWMCKDLCDHVEGCVAADIYGSIEEGSEQYTANCALKSKVERVLLSDTGPAYGYSMDTGFIVEAYFQIVKDELPYILDE